MAGVALGVASVYSIQLLNAGALGAFEASLRAVAGESDLTVLPRGPHLDDALLPRVLAVEGVGAAWPVVRVEVALEGGDGVFLQVVGMDLFAPARLPWRRPPSGIEAPVAVPGWAAVTPSLAGERGWTVGDRFEVSSGTRRVRLTVGALVDLERMAPLASRRIVLMDLSQAQELVGRPGALDQVEVRAASRGRGAVEVLRRRLADRLGPGVEIATPDQRRDEAAGLLSAFRLNLTALSFISLLVGAFLVCSSTQASLARRRTELGLLRSIGATRGQLVVLILLEVALVALPGAALGVPLGHAAALANLDAVSGTLSNLYLLEGIETLRAPAWLAVLAAAVGL
ncbi:MAG TPA: ABC transporter permease, partial [Candidatus Polarisedimenticolia bacterium]|nr:ABC transporter permease [Candidatus Polarisedimenticolia bacterium]